MALYLGESMNTVRHLLYRGLGEVKDKIASLSPDTPAQAPRQIAQAPSRLEADMTRKCPDDRALVLLAMGEAAPRAKDRMLGHLAVCSRCSLRFNVLRELKRDLHPRVEAFVGEHASARTARPSRPPRRSRLGPLVSLFGLRFAAGFIALFLVLASGAFLALSRAARHSELRSPSTKLSLLEPSGTLSSAPTVFRWTPVLNAENYNLELIDDALGRIHTAATFLINEFVLPAEVRAKLVKGRIYVWTVSAQDEDSNRLVSRSGSFVIE